MILVDTVSRGGNLLLDIGPKADGTIPLIMEERLTENRRLLKINGDAIYGTKPWKATQQWSPGEVPKVEYNKEYSTPYDVTKLTETSESGKAGNRSLLHYQGQRPLRDSAALVRPQFSSERQTSE
jgi:alpha-L-fucosidase